MGNTTTAENCRFQEKKHDHTSGEKLSICLALFLPVRTEFMETVHSLRQTLLRAKFNFLLNIVDNSPPDYDSSEIESLIADYFSSEQYRYQRSQTNLGFGAGHNLALDTDSEFHLILNPDLILDEDALTNALAFMQANPECGLLTPRAYWDNGQRQYLCKRYPTVLDLLLRGFAPPGIRKLFQKRLAHYEMADVINEQDVYWDPPIVSGCFMLFRTEVWKQLGGFDPRFFLYFEDFDLSLRAQAITRVAYVPSVRLIHHGGHASRKGWHHIWMFTRSMISFFSIHGWKWW